MRIGRLDTGFAEKVCKNRLTAKTHEPTFWSFGGNPSRRILSPSSAEAHG
jgi:hypothetical protein